MSEYHIVTDSAASIPPGAVDGLPLSILQLWVQVDGRSLREGQDIDGPKLYEFLKQGAIATTSQPSPGDFLEIFTPLVEAGKKVIAVLVTARASGTCDSARMAAEMLPPGSVTVWDSATTAMACGLQAIRAAEAAKAGDDLPEILAKLEQVRAENRVYFAVPTLEHLRRGGRISHAQAILGGILQVKVILTAEEGLIVPKEKIRTWHAAVQRVEELVVQGAAGEPQVLAIGYTAERELAETLLARLQSRIPVVRSYISELSAALAVHGGPGMVGAVYCPARLFAQ